MPESDSFNCEMSSSLLKLVGCSSDKINILQHIKYLFSAIVLALGALVGMNMVFSFGNHFHRRNIAL